MISNPRILATRPLAPHDIEKAAAAGIQADVVPFIQTIPVPTEALIPQLSPLLRRTRTVVFTSANGVKAVAAALGRVQPPWTIACLEGGTLQEVRRCWPGATVSAAAPDARGLAAALLAQQGLQGVVFFCGNIRLPFLSHKLEAAGIYVREIAVYQTVETPVLLTEAYDGILFFSPSAVRSFFSRPQPLHNGTVFFAIGRTTAAALPDGPHPVVIPPKPVTESLIDQVLQYFQSSRSTP